MEAVPRLPMLGFELKSSAESVEFAPKLRQYIRDHYNEDPESYSTEIHELESLRASATHAPHDFTGCSLLKKYYCQLHFLMSRFPLSENPSIAVTFNWYDIYSSVVYNVADIKYEMACILYNIGALHTDLGAMDARNTPDGMKISCTHFQCAAWAFQHLRETYPQPRESDLSPTLLTFMYNVALAQAQECILEKSMTDNRKPTIIAKVAMQVVEYLKNAMKSLWPGKSTDAVVNEIVGSRKLKMWRRYCEFKMAYHGAVALLYQGMQAEEQQKMGERLAYYQAAVDGLTEASKLAKNLEQQELITESLTFSHDVMGGKLTAAQKENEFVYHEKVPPIASLPEVKGASLVKGIAFSVNDVEVSGQDIFQKLVPLEAHQASSMYSEEKAKLLRQVGTAIQEKNEELETYLASMQLDTLALDSNSDSLPQELVESCADLNASSGVKKLTDIMAKISNFSHDINAALEDIKKMLAEEDEKEKEFLAMMGKRGPNMILGELKREAGKYREATQSAQDNNMALHRAITTHLPNLQLLSKPLDQVLAAIPSMTSVEAQGDPAAKQEVKRLLGKVHEMQAQRSKWDAQLRTDIHNDDVTKQLVTNQEDMEDFFKTELKKHDKLVALLEQNMAAQGNILQALSEANAAYATTRRLTNQVQAQRAEMISSLMASYNAYLNILKKAEDAKEFYHKLEGQVNKLSSRVKSVCRVQDEEREEMLSANVKKFTGGVLGAKKGTALPKQPTNVDVTSSTGGGPKLKDYLQHMKGGSGMATAGVPGASMAATHPGAVGYDPNASYVSGVRPAPLGSEQSDPLTSCSGQASAGGYTTSYTGPTSAYHPSAPSPGPSPAPHTSGSPYKTPYSAPGSQYYPQQTGASTYPAASGGMGYVPAQSSTGSAANTSAPAPASTAVAPQPASTTASHPGGYMPTQPGGQHTGPYSYGSQYPYYGYQNLPAGATSTHTSGTPQTPVQHTTPMGVTQHQPQQTQQPQQPQQTRPQPPQQPQPQAPQPQPAPGYSAPLPTSYGATTHTATTSGPPRTAQTPQVHGTNTQGYYGYYQQQTGTVSTPAAAGAVTPQSYHPFQYAQNQGQYIGSMYIQAGSHYSANSKQNVSKAGGVVYSNQSIYAGQAEPSIKGQPPPVSTQAGPRHPLQTFSSLSVTTPQAANLYTHWNMYANYPQGGIASTSVSQAGSASTNTSKSGMPDCPFSNTLATTTATTTATTDVNQAGPKTTPAPVPSSFVPGAQYNQPMLWAQYTGSQQQQQQQQQQPQYQPRLPQTQQAPSQQPPQQKSQQQHGQTYSQQPQQYPQQAYPQHQTHQYPVKLQQHPGQYPAHSQQYPYTQQPQQPQQVPLQPSQQPPVQPQQPHPSQQPLPQQQQQPRPPVPPQHPQGATSTTAATTTTTTTTTTATSATSGISNLDLLSGIELTSPPNSQWSPLMPQPAGSSSTAEPAGVGGQAPAQSGTAPDVTSSAAAAAAATSAQQLPVSGSNLPNIVSSNTAAATTTSSTTPPVPLSSASILDLTALAKSRRPCVVDPLTDDEKLQKLAVETERLSKVVEGLDRKSLNGPTNLELKWKEMVDAVEKECGDLKVSVARCYPLKNRFADILPFDHTRVILSSSPRDDYINASHVQLKSIGESFPMILTQAPAPSTFLDFWTMVWEQQVELIVCLNSDAEVKGQVYHGSEVSSSVDYGPYSVTVHSLRAGSSSTSCHRVLHVTQRSTKITRVIIHLQFLGWPPSAMPETPGPLLQFVGEVHAFQRQQRNKLRPVVVHCVPGLGRSGVLTVLSSFIKEIHSSGGLLDLTSLVVELSRQRRGGVQDKDHLYFLFFASLYYAQDVLMKHQESGKSGSDEDRPRSNSAASLLSNGSSSAFEEPAVKEGQKEGTKASEPSSRALIGSVEPEANGESWKTAGEDKEVEVEEGTAAKTSGLLDSSFAFLPPSLAASLDPLQFKLEPPVLGKPSKITKESFENLDSGGLKKPDDPSDPFSELDPLWSHKKPTS
ncbi:tyrosine-protein phosphatase non-receptor type 23-like isoform X2 [Eriocheir sinensis]|uniref:tyrosine-protein phosphatase non-receptor type 23-like isoform X2 n=1 Tax=Eriocheir sinensis TaxID=95602 RepID=UPI0021CA9E48|nr:tyrosine-protein phosphatase non-receptor type 23-like isoform X2 [Eriocheir sinensis]